MRSLTDKQSAALARVQAKKGNGRAVKHGLDAKVKGNLPAGVEEIRKALAAQGPVRAADGGLPPADEAAFEVTAQLLGKVRHGNHYLAEHGWFDAEGQLRQAVTLVAKLERQLMEHLDRLGMTPTSRARLGLDLARTVDVAQALSEKDPEKREALLREAGIIEGSAEEVG